MTSRIRLGLMVLLFGLISLTNVDMDNLGAGAFLMVGAKAQAAGAESIGLVDELYGAVSVTRDGAADQSLSVGDSVYQNDVIKTAADGSVGIIFVDDTNFGLGPNGEMTLDEFAFNPEGNSNGLLSVAQGTFAFVSGNLAHTGPDALRVKTSTMTIGVRGTKVAGDGNTAVLFPNKDETVGKIMTSTDTDKKLLDKKYQSAYAKDRKSKIVTKVLTQYEAEKQFLKAIKALRDKSGIERRQEGQVGAAREHHQSGGTEAGRHVEDSIFSIVEDPFFFTTFD